MLSARCGRRSRHRPWSTTSPFCSSAIASARLLGDHYGGEFVREPFRKHGISYEVCKQPKSDLFRDMLPFLEVESLRIASGRR